MRIFILPTITVLFLGCAGLAQAASPDGCVTTIASIEGWGDISQSEVACFESDAPSALSLKQLCSVDGRDIGAHFKTYQVFAKKYSDALKALQQAPDQASKSSAILQVGYVEDRWTVFGYRDEIDGLITALQIIQDKCIPAH